MVGGEWLVVGGEWLVVSGWWLVVSRTSCEDPFRFLRNHFPQLNWGQFLNMLAMTVVYWLILVIFTTTGEDELKVIW